MLDVLIYLFEYYLLNQPADKTLEGGRILEDLRQAGFYSKDITQAMAWLSGMDKLYALEKNKSEQSIRVFSEEECRTLDVASRGYLLFLEQGGAIDSSMREVVIDRLLALDGIVTIDKVKWVTLLVMFNDATKHDEPLLLEEILFGNESKVIH